MAPLLSASSSDADTLNIFVPILASCFTFSTYFCKTHYNDSQQSRWIAEIHADKNLIVISCNYVLKSTVMYTIALTCLSNSGGLSFTSVISTVNEQTPSREGSP